MRSTPVRRMTKDRRGPGLSQILRPVDAGARSCGTFWALFPVASRSRKRFCPGSPSSWLLLLRGLPKPEQILARAARDLDTAEDLETSFVTLGKTAEELSKPLPLKGKTKT